MFSLWSRILAAELLPSHEYHLPAGSATVTLREFATSSSIELIFFARDLQGITTNAVDGRFTERQALERLIANTGLSIKEDRSGALLVARPTAARAKAKSAPEVDPAPKSLVQQITGVVNRLIRGREDRPESVREGAADDNGPIRMNPFSVTGDADVGFVAAGSLAGARLATPLKDTPVAYSVVTQEFLAAFNLNDAADASQFSVNVTYNPGDGSMQGFATSGAAGQLPSQAQQPLMIRGQASSLALRNFFPYANTPDSFNLDRIDFTRGPNSVLFGAGGGGGALNSVTKQAMLGRNFTTLRLQAGSWDRLRTTADINQTFSPKLAIRTNLLWASGASWREHEWEDRTGAHVTATYEPVPWLNIRAEAEYRKVSRLTAWGNYLDHLSAWDGVTIPNGPDAGLTTSQMARAGLARFPQTFVGRPDFGGVVMNFQNHFTTTFAKYDANPAATSYVAGQPVRTVGYAANAMSPASYALRDVWDLNYRYSGPLAGSPYFRIPSPKENSLWDDPKHDQPSYQELARDVAVYLSYHRGESLFVELAADLNSSPRQGRNDGRRGLQRLSLDLDRLLPDGRPNPHFLEAYSDSLTYNAYRAERFASLRAHVAYARKVPAGKVQAGLMAGSQNQVSDARADTLILPLTSIAPDARVWMDVPDNNIFGYYRRVYLNDRDRQQLGRPSLTPIETLDPVTGIRTSVRPIVAYESRRPDYSNQAVKNYKFLQLATNLDLFANRLVFIAAARRDLIRVNQHLNRIAPDYPAGWRGDYILGLPDAPPDYESLTYLPKDAAGRATGPALIADTRPRIRNADGVNVAAPQYEADRFRSDYSPPDVSSHANTGTLGAVVNVTKSLGIYVNRSTTFNPASGLLIRDVYGQLIPPTRSVGHDAGFRVTIPNGKLSASLGWFEGRTKGAPAGFGVAGLNFTNLYGTFRDTPLIGDLSAAEGNQGNIRGFSTGTSSTQTTNTKGYEAEITANVGSSLRLMLNVGNSQLYTSSAFLDVKPFIDQHDGTVRKILAEAGVLIDPRTNLASVNPAVDDPTRINQTAVRSAAEAWNILQTSTIPLLQTLSGRGPTNDTGWRVNFASDYGITHGRWKGVRVGLALNYFPRTQVGDRSGDTIRDPNNPDVAIDDPSVGASNPVYAPAYLKGTGTLSYVLVLAASQSRPKKIQFDLIVDNLFGHNRPVYFPANNITSTSHGVAFIPRSGIVSDPARVTIPGNPGYLPPRNFMLTAKFEF